MVEEYFKSVKLIKWSSAYIRFHRKTGREFQFCKGSGLYGLWGTGRKEIRGRLRSKIEFIFIVIIMRISGCVYRRLRRLASTLASHLWKALNFTLEASVFLRPCKFWRFHIVFLQRMAENVIRFKTHALS